MRYILVPVDSLHQTKIDYAVPAIGTFDSEEAAKKYMKEYRLRYYVVMRMREPLVRDG